ncbi:ABC-type cobalamin/Fe3+-siderophores transport system ATPase subunit [Actinokineospora baliensis]|uniref:ATP-binding cassette domain-containing protein n=1 Tax=Actinokineospora baliensis TaxID=547056 RepID=UPI00195CE101|nr:ABC transporter ATP-binding protein [Actinokineospora baliensis]MBM7775534.1 ABC-type cobalamin/Fe3+-siderophores transport system ATPase subunit [Actinokineospora baliensis]
MTALPVRLTGVSCRYGSHTAVRSADLDVPAGQRVALVGTNGSGKSTLLRAVLGFQPITAGVVAVGGSVAKTASQWRARRAAVGWVPQLRSSGRFPLLLDELLASGGDLAAARVAADRLGLGGLGGRGVHTLSGGQVQRAWLARAVGCVAAGAGVLLADEPTAALDFAGQEEAAEVLAGLPVTVVVATHDRAVVRVCDRVVEMAAGELREAR